MAERKPERSPRHPAVRAVTESTGVSDGTGELSWPLVERRRTRIAPPTGVDRRSQQPGRAGSRLVSLWRRQRPDADRRVEALMRANDLLVELRKVSVSLPQEFDLDEVLDRGHDRLGDLAPGAIATILLLESGGHSPNSTFTTVRGRGSHQRRLVGADELPSAAIQALDSRQSTSASLTDGGIATEAVHGVYSALRSRGRAIGLVSVEFRGDDHDPESDAVLPQLVTGVSDALAVAIDNARLLAEMRRQSEADERRRIARDLHDRTGSTLAAIGFEIDRLMTTSPAQTSAELAVLRHQITTAISELRDTLVDLRSTSSDADLTVALKEVASQVATRSGMTISHDIGPIGRVPDLVAHQFLVIAKESVINVERHAKASAVFLTLERHGDSVELRIVDNGRGFDTSALPADRYGIRGMAERADSIGASLELTSDSSGTSVRVTWQSTQGEA